jgi:hypothetical protein
MNLTNKCTFGSKQAAAVNTLCSSVTSNLRDMDAMKHILSRGIGNPTEKCEAGQNEYMYFFALHPGEIWRDKIDNSKDIHLDYFITSYKHAIVFMDMTPFTSELTIVHIGSILPFDEMKRKILQKLKTTVWPEVCLLKHALRIDYEAFVVDERLDSETLSNTIMHTVKISFRMFYVATGREVPDWM